MTRRLLIRPGGIGDCIVSFPALEILKADYTEVWISSPVVPLVQFADCVRAISSTQLDLAGIEVKFPAPLANRLREFDEIISWYGSSRAEFREAIIAVQPRCTFLQALPEQEWQESATDFFLRQVGGVPGLVPKIHVQAKQPRPGAVIHPFSGSAAKNWPLEKYRQLAARLSMPVEWIAGPEESLDGAVRFDNLLELARWMKGAQIYVGNDSGISHLAAAIGLSTVVLFGPSNPKVWGPQGKAVQILQHKPLNELDESRVVEATGYLSRFATQDSGKS